ncbi:MAG: hypothetical protein JW863_16975 [Chitinispirillaceae bacterium]|nr:hypothetical protein [Chitinispirillaceae bacterium]
MRLKGIMGLILLVGGLQGLMGQEGYDTLWLCRNTDPEELWMDLGLADTFPMINVGKFSMVDTGDSQDGSPYINFDYQFNTDPVHYEGKTPMGEDTSYDFEPRPGYAGFKMYWDNGTMSFYTETHDSMVLWHKGPLPGHKVKMIWGQGSAGCGTPINYQDYYEFGSSVEWKRESFGFPESFVRRGLFELRMLIYNDSAAGNLSPTSDPGCLKLDNMFFFKNNAAVRSPASVPHTASDSRHFVPAISGKVTLAVFSLQGEQLFKGLIDVKKGRKYDVDRFARTNSSLPVGWIQCVHITGAGVNVKRKMFR